MPQIEVSTNPSAAADPGDVLPHDSDAQGLVRTSKEADVEIPTKVSSPSQTNHEVAENSPDTGPGVSKYECDPDIVRNRPNVLEQGLHTCLKTLDDPKGIEHACRCPIPKCINRLETRSLPKPNSWKLCRQLGLRGMWQGRCWSAVRYLLETRSCFVSRESQMPSGRR